MIKALAAVLGLEEPEPWRAVVETEVVRPRSRADLVVRGSSWTIVVEAKVDAGEGEIQASRLETDWPEADRLVFLTVAGRRKPRTATDPDRWTALGWRWLESTVSRLAAQTPCRQEARAISARQAVEVWTDEARRSLR